MGNPLDIPELFQAALQALQAYSVTDANTLKAIESLNQTLQQKLSAKPILILAYAKGRMILDGVASSQHPGIALITKSMEERGLYSIAFHRGITTRELKELLLLLDERPDRVTAMGGPEAFFHDKGHAFIRINETDIGFLVRPAGLDETLPGVRATNTLALPVLPMGGYHSVTRGTAQSNNGPIQAPFPNHLRSVIDAPLLSQTVETGSRFLVELAQGGYIPLFQGRLVQLLESLREGETAHRDKAKAMLLSFLQAKERPFLPPQSYQPLIQSVFALLPLQRVNPEVEPEKHQEENGIQVLLGALLGELVTTGDREGFTHFLQDIPRRLPDWGDVLRFELYRMDQIFLPITKLFFREGQVILHSHVIPFFRLMGEPGSRFLLNLLEKEPNRNHRHRLLQLLKELAPDSLPAIRESLSLEPWYFARNVLNLLGELEDTVSVDAMEWCFTHSDIRVRRAAIRAYWRTLKSEAEPLLIKTLHESDPETQMEVLAGLGQIRAYSALPAIVDLAAKAGEPLRIRALECLGELGHPNAIPTLVGYLKRKGRLFKTTAEPLSVRLSAARALVKIGGKEAYEAIKQAIAEEPTGRDKESFQKLLSLFSA